MSTLAPTSPAHGATRSLSAAALISVLLRYNFIFFVVVAIATALSPDFLT